MAMDVYALTRKSRPAHLTLGQNQGQLAQQRPISPSAAPPSVSSTHNRALSSPVAPRSHGNSPSQTREVDKAGSMRTSKVDLGPHIEAVTGPPTRKHWQPDSSATKCYNSTCPMEFSLFERRHHCRCCGHILCAIHCSKYIRLDQNADFHPAGILSRACDMCAADSDRWLKGTKVRGQGNHGPVLEGSGRSGRKKSVVSLSSSGGSTMVSESIGKGQGQSTAGQQSSTRAKRPLMGTGYNGEPGMKELGREDVVRPPGEQVPLDSSTGGININLQRPSDPNLYPIPSVPANWQWSTF